MIGKVLRATLWTIAVIAVVIIAVGTNFVHAKTVNPHICYSQPWPFVCARAKARSFPIALGHGLMHMIGTDRPVLSTACRSAAAQGGPCGCFTSEYFGLPRAYHGLNLWLANDWLHFPHVAPAAGTAAVWPGRHVAPVVGVNEDGTVTISDNIGTRRVRASGLVFVSPRS